MSRKNMGNAWKVGVCAVAFTALSIDAADAARRPQLKCAQPTEVSAIQATVVDQQLGLAALICGQETLDNFNRYRTAFGPEILKQDNLVQTMFRRVYGGAKGTIEYHTFKTNLNGHIELRRIKDAPGFCRSADLVLAAANTAPKPTLQDFVSGVPVTDEETPVGNCAISTEVGLKGVQAGPLVVPRPRPPQPDDQPEVVAMATPAPSPAGVKVGSLTCNVSSGFGFIFGSSKELKCTYNSNSGAGEHYTGTFSKYGLDIGFADKGVLVWGVVAPSSDVRAGALEGDYAGPTASATFGVGLGANVLVGGLDKSIALQPLSIVGSEGLNLAAGVGVITLKYTP
jgi:hypothetical protein